MMFIQAHISDVPGVGFGALLALTPRQDLSALARVFSRMVIARLASPGVRLFRSNRIMVIPCCLAALVLVGFTTGNCRPGGGTAKKVQMLMEPWKSRLICSAEGHVRFHQFLDDRIGHEEAAPAQPDRVAIIDDQ